MVTNGLRKVQAAQRKAAQDARQMDPAQGAAPQAAPQQPLIDPKLESKVAEHRLRLQLMQEAAETKMAIRMAEARQKMSLKDAETASKVSSF